MGKKRAQTIMELWGQNTDNVWSEEEVREFMEKYQSEQALTQFLEQ